MNWTKELNDAIKDAKTLSDVPDFQALVKLAENVARDLEQQEVSSRQIRVLLSETTAGVNRIRQGRTLGMAVGADASSDAEQMNMAAQREAALLNISLVYNAGRDKKGEAAIRQLTDLIGQMSTKVNTFDDYKVLRKFSEAIIAYFKFHGGK